MRLFEMISTAPKDIRFGASADSWGQNRRVTMAWGLESNFDRVDGSYNNVIQHISRLRRERISCVSTHRAFWSAR